MSGIALAGAFYRDVVEPLARGVPHGAALLGDGSEVLGFDDAVSPDHGFGPRVQLFLPPDVDPEPLRRELDRALPAEFGGLPVRYPARDDEPPVHQVLVTTVGAFLRDRLGVDPLGGLSAVDWLSIPSQRLATVTAGAVFADGTGELAAARTTLAWYPPDVWRYLLAAQWQRVSQEEAFVGRTGAVDDPLGSALLAARLVRDHVRLAFLVERRYAPYAKWLGTAFARLRLATTLREPLTAALAADDWRAREDAVCRAGEVLAAATNALGLYPDPPEPTRRRFHGRDIQVLDGGRFTTALAAAITDPAAAALPLLGGIDQFADSTDVLSDPATCQRLRPVWRP